MAQDDQSVDNTSHRTSPPLQVSSDTVQRLRRRFLSERETGQAAEQATTTQHSAAPAPLDRVEPALPSATAELLSQLHDEIGVLRDDVRFLRQELIARRDETQSQLRILELQAQTLHHLAQHRAASQSAPSAASRFTRDHWVWGALALAVVVVAVAFLVERMLSDTAASPSDPPVPVLSGTYRLESWSEIEAGLLPPDVSIQEAELYLDRQRGSWSVVLSDGQRSEGQAAEIICQGTLDTSQEPALLALDESPTAASRAGVWGEEMAELQDVLWQMFCGQSMDDDRGVPFQLHVEETTRTGEVLVMDGEFVSMLWTHAGTER